MSASAQVLQFPLRIAEQAPAVPAPSPEIPAAADLYPEHSALLAKLRRGGIAQIYGIFDEPAWAATTREAELYRLPLNGKARANLLPLVDETRQRAMDVLIHFGWQRLLASTAKAIIREREATGTLLPTIFPDFKQWPHQDYIIQVAYPAIPADIWELAHRAALAGGTLEVAAPANAVRIVDLGQRFEASILLKPQRVSADIDPIVTMRTGETIVVLGRYGEAETLAMATLVQVLEGMVAAL